LGLRANPTKSTCFCAGTPEQIKEKLLALLEMNEGTFPMRYLGVPLITERLAAADCEILVSKITACIESWLVKKLTFLLVVCNLSNLSSAAFMYTGPEYSFYQRRLFC